MRGIVRNGSTLVFVIFLVAVFAAFGQHHAPPPVSPNQTGMTNLGEILLPPEIGGLYNSSIDPCNSRAYLSVAHRHSPGPGNAQPTRCPTKGGPGRNSEFDPAGCRYSGSAIIGFFRRRCTQALRLRHRTWESDCQDSTWGRRPVSQSSGGSSPDRGNRTSQRKCD